MGSNPNKHFCGPAGAAKIASVIRLPCLPIVRSSVRVYTSTTLDADKFQYFEMLDNSEKMKYTKYSCYTVMHLNRKEAIKIDDYTRLTTLMERVIHKYSQWENKKRTYGTSMLLSKAEIHTIVAVGNNPGINVTTLADILGITKGAASQMIYKLVEKGSVEKKVSPDSDTEVILNLTNEGLKNYATHNEYHSQANDESIELLKTMPESFCEYMIEFLSAFEKTIDKKLKEE